MLAAGAVLRTPAAYSNTRQAKLPPAQRHKAFGVQSHGNLPWLFALFAAL